MIERIQSHGIQIYILVERMWDTLNQKANEVLSA